MTLLFMDSFSHYATADITKKWTSIAAGTPAIAPTGGPRGGGALQAPSNTGGATRIAKNLGSAYATLIVGVRFKCSALPSGAVSLIRFGSAANALQCDIQLSTGGALIFTLNGTTAVNTSSAVIAQDVWYYIEVKITFATGSGGSYTVRVGESNVLTGTSTNTANSGSANAQYVTVGTNTAITSLTFSFADLYVLNSLGSANNDFKGDYAVEAVFPDSDGTYTAFTPSTGASHFALVDESTPNTTDYNDGAAANDRDSYGFAALRALVDSTIAGVQVNAAIQKDDAGARSAGTFARSGTTNSDGAGVALSTSQTYISQVYETDPNTSTAWTDTTVNAAEFGVKVTA